MRLRIMFKIFGYFTLAIVVVFLLTVVTAGVTVTIANKSEARVDAVMLAYEIGEVSFGPLDPGDKASERLGKIGEGVV